MQAQAVGAKVALLVPHSPRLGLRLLLFLPEFSIIL